MRLLLGITRSYLDRRKTERANPLWHRKDYQMERTNGLEGITRLTAPVASNTLGVNVFTAPGKAMVGERPKPFGEALGFDPLTPILIFAEHDAVLVDAMCTVAEAEALADWVAPDNRSLETIYRTYTHFDHFYGLSILLDRFPGARAIATPRTLNAIMQIFLSTPVKRLARRVFPGQVPTKWVAPEPYERDTFTLEGHELRIIEQGHHPREPKKLDRRARQVGGAEPGDGCCRSPAAGRARLSLSDPGHQALPRGFRSGAANREV